jgi:hypothetical protein
MILRLYRILVNAAGCVNLHTADCATEAQPGSVAGSAGGVDLAQRDWRGIRAGTPSGPRRDWSGMYAGLERDSDRIGGMINSARMAR